MTLLAVALLAGGAGNGYPIIAGVIEILALAVMAQTIVAGNGYGATERTSFVSIISGLLIAVPVAQCIPLPPALWLALPGRELPAHVLAASGMNPGWRPFSLDPALTIMTALEMLPGAAMFWATRRLNLDARVRLVSLVVGIAALSALLGAVQKVSSGNAALIFYQTAHGANAPGLFVNRNHQACFLLAAMPLVAGLGRSAHAARRLSSFGTSAIVLPMLGLLGAGALATTSRMGLLLLPPTLLAAAVVGYRPRRRRDGLILLSAVAALLGMLAALSSTGDVTAARFVAGEDGRAPYWSATREAITRFWPAGSGIGTFPRIYAVVEHLDAVDVSFPYNAHNDYLELLLEGGVVALALMLCFVGFLLVAIARLWRRADEEQATLGLSAWCAIIVILLHSSVDYPLRMLAIMTLFGLLVGVVADAVAPGHAGMTTARTVRARTGRR